MILQKLCIFESVDCKWGAWVIGQCSKTCGGGKRTNTRTRKLEADHGGIECHGSSSMTETCSQQKCDPGIKFFDNYDVPLINNNNI